MTADIYCTILRISDTACVLIESMSRSSLRSRPWSCCVTVAFSCEELFTFKHSTFSSKNSRTFRVLQDNVSRFKALTAICV